MHQETLINICQSPQGLCLAAQRTGSSFGSVDFGGFLVFNIIILGRVPLPLWKENFPSLWSVFHESWEGPGLPFASLTVAGVSNFTISTSARKLILN